MSDLTTNNSMRVNHLAELARVSKDTVRYYTRIGLLHPRRNRANGYREYNQREYRRLCFVLSARQLGFSIRDIKIIIDEASQGNSPCPVVRDLISLRLSETEQLFRETADLRVRMKHAMDQWQSKPDRLPTGDMICHLIEEFESEGKYDR